MDKKIDHFEHFSLKYTPNSLINSLFSANYTILRILNEQSPLNQPTQAKTYTSQDIFNSNQSMYEYWLDGKVEAYSELRNNLIKEFYELIPSRDDAYKLFLRNTSKFMKAYNNVYGTQKKYEDLFDRKYLLDQNFANDYSNRLNKTIVQSAELKELFELYDELLGFLTDYYCIESAREIAEALQDDLSTKGYRTFFYDKPSNPNIVKLDWNTFVDVSNMVAEIYNEATASLKLIGESMELVGKRYEKDPNNPDIQQQYLDLLQAFSPTYSEQYIAEHLLTFFDEIEKRFNSANTTYEGFSTKIRDKLFNLISNQKLSPNNENLYLDSVYIHRNEMSDILDMFQALDGTQELYNKLVERYPHCRRQSIGVFQDENQKQKS